MALTYSFSDIKNENLVTRVKKYLPYYQTLQCIPKDSVNLRQLLAKEFRDTYIAAFKSLIKNPHFLKLLEANFSKHDEIVSKIKNSDLSSKEFQIIVDISSYYTSIITKNKMHKLPQDIEADLRFICRQNTNLTGTMKNALAYAIIIVLNTDYNIPASCSSINGIFQKVITMLSLDIKTKQETQTTISRYRKYDATEDSPVSPAPKKVATTLSKIGFQPAPITTTESPETTAMTKEQMLNNLLWGDDDENTTFKKSS